MFISAILPEGLAELSPGPELAHALTSFDLARCSSADLVRIAQSQARQISHEQARLLEIVLEAAYAEAADPRSDHTDTAGDRGAGDGASCDGGAGEGGGVPGRVRTLDGFSAAPLSFALSWSEPAMEGHLHLAQDLIERLPSVYQALHLGRIDLIRARIFADALADLTDTAAQAIADALITRAEQWTPSELRRKLRVQVIRADPTLARTRYDRTVYDRYVYNQPYTDGTAQITANHLPPDLAAAAYNHLDRLARAAKAAGDARNLRQLRTDAFLDLLIGKPFTRVPSLDPITAHADTVARDHKLADDDPDDLNNTKPPPTPRHRTTTYLPTTRTASKHRGKTKTASPAQSAAAANHATTGANRNPPSDTGNGTGSAGNGHGDTNAGAGRASAGRHGAGTHGAGTHGAGTHIASARGADGKGVNGHRPGDSGQRDEDFANTDIANTDIANTDSIGVATFQAGDLPADHQPDHDTDEDNRYVPADLVAPSPTPTADTTPAKTRTSDGAPLRANLLDRRQCTCGVIRPARRRGVVDIHMQLTTLMRLNNNPAIIPGWGPILAEIARQVAEDQATNPAWKYSITDSRGKLLHHGHIKRRPTNTEKAFVKARDKTCRTPGCNRPATTCDDDHRQEWADNGPSHRGNLTVLCRHHHRLRHERGYTIQELPDGTYLWIAPNGLTYTVPPDDTLLDHDDDVPPPTPATRSGGTS